MMESSSLEDDSINKTVRNLFRLERLKRKQLIPQLKV